MNDKLYRLNGFDVFTAVLILFLSSIPLFSFVGNTSKGNKADIYRENKLIKTINLSKDTSFNVGEMIIEVKNGKIHVQKSNCPAQVCVHTGWTDHSYKAIVCLPNKVLIEVRGDSENEYNAVSY